jgi:hydrogenase expression/formation protein HypE
LEIERDPQGVRLGVKAAVGEVVDDHPGMVTMKTAVGGSRVVDMLSGEQLPRIC